MTSRARVTQRTGPSPAERALSAVARRVPGVRTVRRPATTRTPELELAYVRTRPRAPRPGRLPAVVIPGGPGLGSILPYRTLRRIASRAGLDLIMVEHRGVGLSRRGTDGTDLPWSAMRVSEVVDDIAAVLDQEGVPQAHVVGSSYGSYLASSFGVVHPERVAGMLLDSALQSAHHLDLERAVVRALLWDDGGERSAAVRRLSATGIDQRVLLDVTRAAYELGGDDLLLPLVHARTRTDRTVAWTALESYATRGSTVVRVPGVYDFDLAGVIGFRELGYGGTPDGLPLDPALTYAPLAGRYPELAGEPYDLLAGARGFDWPLVLLSGTRDLRTPTAIAEQVAEAAPQSVLVRIENGHSALDTHPVAVLVALRDLVDRTTERLRASGSGARLDRLPRRGIAARAPQALTAVVGRGSRGRRQSVAENSAASTGRDRGDE